MKTNFNKFTTGASRLWQRIATLYRRLLCLSFDVTGTAHSTIVRLGSTQPRAGPLYGCRWSSSVAVATTTTPTVIGHETLWKVELFLWVMMAVGLFAIVRTARQWLINHKGNYPEAAAAYLKNAVVMCLAPHRCLVYAALHVAGLTCYYHQPLQLGGVLMLLAHGLFGSWVIDHVPPGTSFKRHYFACASIVILFLWQTPLNFQISYEAFTSCCAVLGDIVNRLSGYSGPALCCADKVCDGRCNVASRAVSAGPPPPSIGLAKRALVESFGPGKVSLMEDAISAYPLVSIGLARTGMGVMTFAGLKGASWRVAGRGTASLATGAGTGTAASSRFFIGGIHHHYPLGTGGGTQTIYNLNGKQVVHSVKPSGAHSYRPLSGADLNDDEVSSLAKLVEMDNNRLRSRQIQSQLSEQAGHSWAGTIGDGQSSAKRAMGRVLSDPIMWTSVAVAGVGAVALERWTQPPTPAPSSKGSK